MTVIGLLLPLLPLILAALTSVALLGFFWPPQAARLLWAAAALAGVGAVLALLALLTGAAPDGLRLPIGLPGAEFRLQLDPLAAFFALLLFTAGGGLCGALAPTVAAESAAGPVPLALAAFGLAVLGAGALPRASGIAIAGAAIWLLRPTVAEQNAGTVPIAISLLAAAAIAVGAAAPLPAWVWLAMLGPGALAGLVPWHGWMLPAQADATPAASLLAGVAAPVAIYAMLRLLFAGASVPPGWWGLPLLAQGAASVLLGGWQEARQPGLAASLAAGTSRQAGLVVIGMGLTLTARAADLPDVAAMALAAVLLLTVLQALCGTLLALAGGALQHGAGTDALDRMGGLIHRMPATTACLLAGMASLAALPPSGGFGALWLLFHAVLGLPHATALPFRLLLCALAAVLGLAAALNLASLLRLIGVACLGRPRTPRTAVAEEQPRPAIAALLVLALAALAWGGLVGPLLRLLADGPVRLLAQTGLAPATHWAGVAQGAESPGYAALPLTLLVVVVAGTVLWLRRRHILRTGLLEGPAWSDGFAAPPGWLPFGDPATQVTSHDFLPRPPNVRVPHLRLHSLPLLPAPAVALILTAALLAICAWIPPA